MKIAYNPTGGSALSKSQIDSLKNDIIFDLSGMAVYARGIPVGKVYLPFEKSTSSTTEGYNGLVPFPDYNGNSKTRFLREDGTWVVPTNNYRPISINGTPILENNNTVLNLVAGNNITLSPKKDSNNKYTGEVTITASNHAWSNITGKPTTLAGYGITDAVDLTSNQTISGVKTFSNLRVNNSTMIANLNADTLDGYHATSFGKVTEYDLTAGSILRIDMSGQRGFLISTQGTNTERNALYFVTGYGYGTTSRNSLRVIKSGPFDVYFNGESESGCVYIKYNGDTIGPDKLYIHPFGNEGIASGVVSAIPSDAVLVSTSNRNIIATLGDNVASATKLATPRTIWGQRFDGTNNVSGALYLGATGILGGDNLNILFHSPSGYLDIGYDSATAGHSTYINGNSIHFRYSTEHKTGILISSNGNVAIGAVSPTAKLHVNGDSIIDGNLTAASFLGNLDGSYINKLTGYTKATAVSAITANDTLNAALGKLELKADTAYNWYKSVTGTDNDDIINKWEEIVDFIDSVKEGTDITDEFVTRKTTQTITGAKTFSEKLIIESGHDAKLILNNTDTENKYLQIVFKLNGEEYGRLGTYYSDVLQWSNNIILHSGNTHINNGIITINGNTITPLTTGYIGTTQILTTSKIQALTGITSLNMSDNINILSGNSDKYITFGYSNNAFTSIDAYSWRLGYIGSGENNSNYFKIQSSHGNTWTDVLKLGLLTYEATFSGNVIASGNVTASGDIIIKNSGINAATPYLKFQRGSTNDSYVDWRLGSTNNGKLILQYNINGSNTTTETWNDVFVTTRTISTFNSALEVAGSLLTLGNSNESTLLFKRPNASYIWADEPGGYFVIGVKDAGTTSAGNASLLITKEFIQPGRRNNAVYLGNSSYRWANVFSVLGNFSGNVTAAGFVKSGSSDSHVLLGAGGHKALSDFLLKSEIANQELSVNLTTITKSLTVTADWKDTGIDGDDLETGTYIVQVTCNANVNSIGYNLIWSGVMSWWKGRTNDDETDEILLHRSGQSVESIIYLRTIMRAHTDTNGLKLLISANKNLSSAEYIFKFKRII